MTLTHHCPIPHMADWVLAEKIHKDDCLFRSKRPESSCELVNGRLMMLLWIGYIEVESCSPSPIILLVYTNLTYDLQAPRCFVLVAGAAEVINSTVGSSITGGAMDQISEHFNIKDQQTLVLPISVYLIGYILGPMLWGPASEAYGRRHPLRVAFTMFTVFMMACAVANLYPSLLVFRLLDGISVSAPIAVVGGVYADLYSDPTAPGRLMANYMAVRTALACLVRMSQGGRQQLSAPFLAH